MARAAKAGPAELPWASGHYDEIVVWIVSALIGAIIGDLMMKSYRKAQGRRP